MSLVRCAVAVALCISITLPAMGVASPASVSARTETCHGMAPTMVGVPGQPLEGTSEADVIVSNGASSVDALGGDDSICISRTDSEVPVTVRAGDGDDLVVTVFKLQVEIHLGPGQDSAIVGRYLRGTLNGGEGGQDNIEVTAGGGSSGIKPSLYLNLGTGRYRSSNQHADVARVTHVEDAEVRGFLSGTLIGNEGPNELALSACSGTVRGGRGGDLAPDTGTRCWGDRDGLTLSGGRGDDVLFGGWLEDTLRGGRGDDTLIGLEGRDFADGDRGTDYCEAERVLDCEQ